MKSRGEGGCGGGGVEREDEGNGRREKEEGKREEEGREDGEVHEENGRAKGQSIIPRI